MGPTVATLNTWPESQAARDRRSDDLKAAAILGVVCIHAMLPYFDVFRYCVPVFVTLWAYFYELGLSRRGQAWGYAARRFVRLLVPYAFWTGVYVVLLQPIAQWRTVPLRSILGGWLGGAGFAGQYFFIILFQLNWLVPLLRSFVTLTALWITLFAGVVFNALADYYLFRNYALSGLNDRVFVYWLPYVALGIALARGYPAPKRGWLLAALVLLAAPWEIARLEASNPRISPYLVPSVVIGSLALLLAVAARHPSVLPVDPAPPKRVRRLIRYVGSESFAIFVGHYLILQAAWHAGLAPGLSAAGVLGRMALVVVAIAGSLGISWLLQRLGLGIVVGK
jgi:fucose 4-O-acetylase-like acetyltransferase